MRRDEIVVVGAHAGLALAAAALRAERGQGHALDPALVGDGDDHVLALDQVLDVEVGLGLEVDEGAARGVEQFLDLRAARLASPRAAARASAGSAAARRSSCAISCSSSVSLSRSSAVRRCRRSSRIAFACSSDSRSRRRDRRRGLALLDLDQPISGSDVGQRPGARHQARPAPPAGRRRRGSAAITSSMLATATHEADDDVRPLARLGEVEGRAAEDHLLAEGDERLDHLPQAQLLRAGRRAARPC